MAKARKQTFAVGATPDETEAAFYEALQHGDIERLMACWADEDEISCVHPGGPRQIGIGAIRSAFDALFSNGCIRAWPEALHRIDALASSVHSVRERIEVLTEDGPRTAYVIATNVYHKTAQGWRMVAHHASAASMQEPHDANSSLHLLH